MRSLPVRVRLTIWYSLVLALCLGAFGATVWVGLRQSLITARQAELSSRIGSLRAVLQNLEEFPSEGTDNLAEEVSEFSRALPKGTSIRLLDASNSVIYQSNSFDTVRSLESEGSVKTGNRVIRIKMYLSLEPVDEILQRLNGILLLSIALVLVVASGGGYWLSKRALAPVREMAMAARSIDSADLSKRLPVPIANDELRLLAGMWNEMLERLQSSVERIQRFTSDASHDLRTPLATIRASAEIALRRNREPESYKDTLERILHQTNRATTLVEGLLTLARGDSGHFDMVLSPLDLCALVRDGCDGLRPLARAKHLEFCLALPAEPIWVNADPGALMKVIAILVDNAVRHTEAGSIRVQLERASEQAILTVQDTGSGIGSEDLPYVFDRFYRGDKSRTSANGGSGLGLSIAKRLVEFHRGTITVESPASGGTCCSVGLLLLAPIP
jgi:signal transduction histidine kinase